MNKFQGIRPIALGLAIHNNKVLAHEGFDTVKQETFYRVLGGGIEFLETSEQALVREFKEEINADIKVLEKLDVVENIFVFDGQGAHEIVFLYRIEIPAEQIQEQYTIVDNGVESVAKWVDQHDITIGGRIIYPEAVRKYL